MISEFIFEIGFLSLPKNAFGRTEVKIAEKLAKALQADEISFDSLEIWISQYRTAMLVTGLKEFSEKAEIEVRGPKLKVCYDHNNQPTPALRGFASAQNAKIEDLVIKEQKGEKFVFATTTAEPMPKEQLLTTVASHFALALPFALKHWEKTPSEQQVPEDIVLPQPPLYVLAIYNGSIPEIEFEGIKPVSFSKRRIGGKSEEVEVKTSEAYRALMKDFGLMPEIYGQPYQAQDKIKKVLDAKSIRLAGDAAKFQNWELFTEGLQPVVINFDMKYQEMPQQLIKQYLFTKTQFLPCENSMGNLVASALAFLDASVPEERTRPSAERCLNQSLGEFYKLWLEERKEMPAAMAKISEKIEDGEILVTDEENILDRASVYIAEKLGIDTNDPKLLKMLALLRECDDTDITRNVPKTAFAMLVGCLKGFSVLEDVKADLQDVGDYFSGLKVRNLSPYSSAVTLAIMFVAHVSLAKVGAFPPADIITFLIENNLHLDISLLFRELFETHHLDVKNWINHVIERALNHNPELVWKPETRFYATGFFDPLSLYNYLISDEKAASEQEAAEYANSLFTRIKNKIAAVGVRIEAVPESKIELEIDEDLQTLENLNYPDYLKIHNFFIDNKVSIEACLMNLPPVLDSEASVYLSRISILQRLETQLEKLPYIK